ncbi:hypothetical protein A28LD_1947 [Idiomarina sp. A28L]|uniref:hypothetical protein n=1 Tax=Idiomarina sp. A28L TaxID=1036674 RepID=UPI00021388DD|nr:hypothetical protein [Idiomarina sp. A28L]EGN74453.1 hypothetical protein A28LD_1947 [Idiomarina sp. A28L]
MSHNNFILSPLSTILNDVTTASLGAGSGIETFPLCDYVMQSVFLKLTGAQEQKMKCIRWALASDDYEYRHNKLNKRDFGDCSTYKDKESIYKDLVTQIIKIGKSDFNDNFIDKQKILNQTIDTIRDCFVGTNLYVWAENSFLDYKKISPKIDISHFARNKTNLLTGIAIEIYTDHLYRHRNRIAHNTLSYQQNLPTLRVLESETQIYENYFLYFYLLILIDNVFIDLYKKYLETLEEFPS